MDKAPLRPKLIHGKVWVPSTDSGYRKLPEDDPSYQKFTIGSTVGGSSSFSIGFTTGKTLRKTAITPIKKVIKTANDREKWKGMNEASFNRKLRRLQNAEARARRLREELDSARETWQRNYDKLDSSLDRLPYRSRRKPRI